MKEMYVALSGAITREKQLALVSNNLANVQSVGFKKQQAVFELRPPAPDTGAMLRSHDPELGQAEPRARVRGDRAYVRLADSYTDYTMGDLRATTENPLDLALVERHRGPGAAFFSVQTPQGPRLTRMGNFLVDREGRLVLPGGEPVLDAGGNAIEIGTDPERAISIAGTGEIFNGDQRVAQLQLFFAERPEALVRQGHGFFHDPEGQAGLRPLEAGDQVQVTSGYLEYSNVNIVEELVKMIELQRAYTTAEKAIQTFDQNADALIGQTLNG